jgi:hypothetical protein
VLWTLKEAYIKAIGAQDCNTFGSSNEPHFVSGIGLGFELQVFLLRPSAVVGCASVHAFAALLLLVVLCCLQRAEFYHSDAKRTGLFDRMSLRVLADGNAAVVLPAFGRVVAGAAETGGAGGAEERKSDEKGVLSV